MLFDTDTISAKTTPIQIRNELFKYLIIMSDFFSTTTNIFIKKVWLKVTYPLRLAIYICGKIRNVIIVSKKIANNQNLYSLWIKTINK
ncbi:hypothetical protein CLI91_14065 [Lentilactobacillus hilgardii]|nr:hypothetical protein [Lentilactobacillus hilgardii]MBZ2205401.1 hypothetical protein [Lentilactobacillus hilgardii]